MDLYYLLLVVILIYIIWNYSQKSKHLNKKDNSNGEQQDENIINSIINFISNFFNRIVSTTIIKPYIWTYIEPHFTEKDDQLLNDQKIQPSDYFRLCVDHMKKHYPSIIVLTPDNISKYLKGFPVVMGPKSEIPLRKRVDLLFSFVLEKYGGLCLSPGTITIDISELIHQTKIKDIVTCGNSPNILPPSIQHNTPDTLVIGGKKGSQILKNYKFKLMEGLNNVTGEIDQLDSYDILSSLIKEMKPKQFHANINFVGTHDKYLQKINIDRFLSKNKLEYSDSPLFMISFPYEEVFEKKYRWFLELSKKELKQSEISIIEYLI